MSIRRCKMMALLMALVVGGVMFLTQRISASGGGNVLDDQLSTGLSHHGFTGTVGSSMEQRLGRRIDNQLADLGRNLFHDTIVGLNNDNSCSGCHSATAGFGDTQSIAIGVENNFIV
ncbi:MAG: cytochrome c peroxidase, partial [Sporichthyaceae bacterium]